MPNLRAVAGIDQAAKLSSGAESQDFAPFVISLATTLSDGNPIIMSNKEDKTITLQAGTHWMCTCGKSANFPFCNGAHKGSGAAPKKLELEKETVIPIDRPRSED